jgi:Rrf2 family protein
VKLSAQEEYGLRLLLRLSREGEGGSLTIPELSRLEGISSPNVGKMMRVLRKGGLVTSTRGKEGGYTLARAPERINVGEALCLLGGRLYDARFCERHKGDTGGGQCTHTSDCSIRSVWQLLQQAIDGVLLRLSLKDLLRSEQELGSLGGARSIPIALSPRSL